MRNTYVIIIIAIMVLTGCKPKSKSSLEIKTNDSTKSNNGLKMPDVGDLKNNSNENSPKTLNGIELNAKDVQVNRAFLSLESGDLLPSDNTVALGEKISLVINIDNGWKEIGGKCFIGASEKITTDNGTTLLDSDDMFAAYDQTGLDASDAKVITLKARITSEPPGTVEYYIVNFRVWDKKGNGEITGKYKFHLK